MTQPPDPNANTENDTTAPPAKGVVRILGIDPGLNTTGYGLLDIVDDQLVLVEAGIVTSKRKETMGQRLASIHSGICDVIQAFDPTSIAIEQLYSHYERPQTAILMGHARGVICLAGALSKKPMFDYAATQVKKVLTGNGRAPKVQVQCAVSRQLGLEQIPEPADVADALAIAACHYFLTLKTASLT